jgi:hypothetical protein
MAPMQPDPLAARDPEIEWIILADSAEALGGKLYMLGGAWDRINVRTGFPFDHHMTVSVSVLVPWHRTNEKHVLSLQLTDEDGAAMMPKIDAEFEVGRPSGAVHGQSLRSLVVFNIAGLKLPRPGTYSIAGLIDGEERNTTSFHVIPVLGSPAAQTPPKQPPTPRT